MRSKGVHIGLVILGIWLVGTIIVNILAAIPWGALLFVLAAACVCYALGFTAPLLLLSVFGKAGIVFFKRTVEPACAAAERLVK